MKIREETNSGKTTLKQMMTAFSKLDGGVKAIVRDEKMSKLSGATANLILKNRQACCRMVWRLLKKKISHNLEPFIAFLLDVGTL